MPQGFGINQRLFRLAFDWNELLRELLVLGRAISKLFYFLFSFFIPSSHFAGKIELMFLLEVIFEFCRFFLRILIGGLGLNPDSFVELERIGLMLL